MKETYTASHALLQDLGGRVKAYRIDYPLTQKQLADRSGVSLRCIQRLESGEDIQTSNLFKILQALGLSDRLEQLIPDPAARPSAFLGPQKKRFRVRTAASYVSDSANRFRWGDEK